MAKIILKCMYLQPGMKNHSKNLVKYIAQRDHVDKIDDSWKYLPVSIAQKQLIGQLLEDFPDAKNSYEYHDYIHAQNKGNASQLISRTLENNFDRIGTRENYMRYIAYRPGAERFGTHGLFTDANIPIDLGAVAEEVSAHKGRVWTDIVSIRREDAARLGYETGDAWRSLIRGQAQKIAECMKIPREDLRWYAAFHNESHHPHVHIVAYSVGKEPYLSKQGIKDLKSSFAHEIFKQDLMQAYETQTQYRNRLSAETRDQVQKIVEEINRGTNENQTISLMLRRLSEILRHSKGKKVYGYLPQTARNLVNNILDELAKNADIAELYGLWYQQRDLIVQTYHNDGDERIPLSQNKAFHSIRNVIVREALNLSPDAPAMATEVDMPDDPADEVTADEPEVFTPPVHIGNEPGDEIPPLEEPKSSQERVNWWTDAFKQARKYLYGTRDEPPQLERAFDLMQSEAKAGNGLAMHDLGKMLLSGLGCEKNEVQAQSMFLQAHSAFCQMEQADKKPYYWQYRIGKMYSYGYGVEQDYSASAEWFARAVEGNSPFAAYALGGQYYRGQGVEQDFSKAFSLFTMAATDEKKPNAYAQYQLGRMCRDGIGTAVDRSASEYWYCQAYQGFLSMEQTMADDKLYYRLGSMNLSGTGTEVDLSKAKLYLEKAAELDNTDALYGLGKLYLRKDFDGYDPAKAAAYLEKAAMQEHSYAQYLLGKTLLHGDGVDPDPKRAVKLLERSIEQENLYAAYTLGKAYLSGEAIPQNIERAIHLLTDAAERDLDTAQYALAKLYLADELVPVDKEKALCWLRKAVALENQYAQYQLGKMLLFGQGIDRDIESGKQLLQASADQGNEYAQRILNNYGRTPIALAGFRLLSGLAQMFQEEIQQQEQKNSNHIDRKLRQKIEEKKQAQGIKMG